VTHGTDGQVGFTRCLAGHGTCPRREFGLDGFCAIRIEEPKLPAAVQIPNVHSGTLDVIKGCGTVWLDASVMPERIAQIAAAL
jgi:hypothetical protein